MNAFWMPILLQQHHSLPKDSSLARSAEVFTEQVGEVCLTEGLTALNEDGSIVIEYFVANEAPVAISVITFARLVNVDMVFFD